MAVVIIPNEGKDFWNKNVMSNRTLYYFLLQDGVTVAADDITATDLLADIDAHEATGTGYARTSTTVGTSVDGIMDVPGKTFDPSGQTDWPSDVAAYGLASAATAGTAIIYWDLTAERNMSTGGTALVLHDQSIFIYNPGEV